MTDLARIITFTVEESESGLFMVRSDDLPTIMLSDRDLAAIRAQIPDVIRAHFHHRYNLTVEVLEAVNERERQVPAIIRSMVAIPRGVSSPALAAE